LNIDSAGMPYIQREISWNAFNRRVLDEGLKKDSGPLDQLKFISIVSSNYDEFFMVRIASLIKDCNSGNIKYTDSGLRPCVILLQLLKEIHGITDRIDSILSKSVFPELKKNGINIIAPGEPEPENINRIYKDNKLYDFSRKIILEELVPVAAPLFLENPAKINNYIYGTSIYTAFQFSDESMAVIKIPGNLERFRFIKEKPENTDSLLMKVLLLEDIAVSGTDLLFPGKKVSSVCQFRIIRDADLSVDEKRDEDFIAAMEEVLLQRGKSRPVRIETRGNIELAEKLAGLFSIPPEFHFHTTSPLELKLFMQIYGLSGFEHLKDKLPEPQEPAEIRETDNIFDILKERNVILHHPYESFQPVIKMLEKASEDSDTLAIKMTLYRTSGKSPIVKALIAAAQRGIQVTVLVELKARFNENANINWAEKLEKAGAIVVYGLVVLKVHAKTLLIVKKEKDGIRYYAHLGTGNYNEQTAELYTDISLLTSQNRYTKDVAFFFNAITGYSAEPRLETLIMAPFSLRNELLTLISRETAFAENGENAFIYAKMNSLVDPEIINALYKASAAGVKIKLNVRGICSLVPGVKNVSENIEVVSIIDFFLEHSRIYIFHNGGENSTYISSADWMSRNLDKRIELLIPVYGRKHKKRLYNILETFFRDNTNAWVLKPGGEWQRKKASGKPFRAQSFFADLSKEKNREIQLLEKKTLKVRRTPS
jgi:polyphosphate kinase